ncbi:MAG: glycosyltransferase, partial [Candidatus Binatota bacterium]
ALAQAISKLLSQPGLAQQMGESGRERVRKHFTVEQMAKKNEDFYYELLEDQFDPHLLSSPYKGEGRVRVRR